ncbi:putative zinc finger protein 830 [Blattamonas nauphoetae]|uniref:Zinc finger protein 830 n=1 Tax=Blattamonas nauphoetae TaxID=2049346 RepID=A0ABQ9YF64_9EUKA|nr:putative zinc finger protein 830 [Blattamonas nauphoetae]
MKKVLQAKRAERSNPSLKREVPVSQYPEPMLIRSSTDEHKQSSSKPNLPDGFFDTNEPVTQLNSTLSVPGSSQTYPSALPVGFFDDIEQDAKAHGISKMELDAEFRELDEAIAVSEKAKETDIETILELDSYDRLDYDRQEQKDYETRVQAIKKLQEQKNTQTEPEIITEETDDEDDSSESDVERFRLHSRRKSS